MSYSANFDGGTNGSPIVAGGAITSVTGAPTYTDAPSAHGGMAARFSSGTASTCIRCDTSPSTHTGSLYLYIPAENDAIIRFVAFGNIANTTTVCNIRLRTNRVLALANASTVDTVVGLTVIPLAQWVRVDWMFNNANPASPVLTLRLFLDSEGTVHDEELTWTFTGTVNVFERINCGVVGSASVTNRTVVLDTLRVADGVASWPLPFNPPAPEPVPAYVPDIKTEVAFETTPLDIAPAFTDVSDYVNGFRIQRGRSYELDEVESGTGSITFDNEDGRFTPGRVASPYYPNVRPRRAVKLSVNDELVSVGFIEKWPARFDSLLGSTEATFVDGFGILASTKLPTPVQAFTRFQNPLHYYPLNEAAEATEAVDVMGNARGGRVKISDYGGAATLGGAQVPTYGDQGGASFEVTTADGDAAGAALELKSKTDPVTFDLSKFAISLFYSGPRPAVGQANTLVYFEGYDAFYGQTTAEAADASKLRIQVLSNGAIYFWGRSLSRSGGVGRDTVITSAAGVIPINQPVHIMFHRVNDGGIDDVGILYVNGVEVGRDSMIDPTAIFPVTLAISAVQAGGEISPLGRRYLNEGQYSHLTLWGPLSNPTTVAAGLAVAKGLAARGLNVGAGIDRTETSRLNEILDYAGWPSAWRTIGTGDGAPVSTLDPADWEAGASALEAFQKAAKDAGGTVFIGRAGFMAYLNRHSRLNVPPLWHIGSDYETDYEPGLFFEADEDRIANEVIGKRTLGAQTTATDQASIDEYGRRTVTLELGVATDSEAADAAGWYLHRYKDTIIRLDQVVILPSVNNADPVAAYFKAAIAEIGWKVKLWDLPEAGPFPEAEFFLEGIQHDVSISGEVPEWKTTLQLSPATNTDGAVLDDDQFGLLDETAILIY